MYGIPYFLVARPFSADYHSLPALGNVLICRHLCMKAVIVVLYALSTAGCYSVLDDLIRLALIIVDFTYLNIDFLRLWELGNPDSRTVNSFAWKF